MIDTKNNFHHQLALYLTAWLGLASLLFATIDANAQTHAPSDTVAIITLKDSSVYVGDILLKRDSNLVIQVLHQSPRIIYYRDTLSVKKALRKDVDTVIQQAAPKKQTYRHSATYLNMGAMVAFGIYYALNYSYTVPLKSNLSLSFGLGYGGYAFAPITVATAESDYDGSGPIGRVSLNWFSSATHLSTGIGLGHYHSSGTSDKSDALSVEVGLKHQHPHKALYYEASMAPWLFTSGVEKDSGGMVLVYTLNFSLGFTF